MVPDIFIYNLLSGFLAQFLMLPIPESFDVRSYPPHITYTVQSMLNSEMALSDEDIQQALDRFLDALKPSPLTKLRPYDITFSDITDGQRYVYISLYC